MTPRTETRDTSDAPSDGFGAGYLTHRLREDFDDLCRIVGFENARQEMAEIINAKCERRHQ